MSHFQIRDLSLVLGSFLCYGGSHLDAWVEYRSPEMRLLFWVCIFFTKTDVCHRKFISYWKVLRRKQKASEIPAPRENCNIQAILYIIIYIFIYLSIQILEKEMTTHSSILAWRVPWTEEPGRLQSMGSQRVGHNWATSLTQLHSKLPQVNNQS